MGNLQVAVQADATGRYRTPRFIATGHSNPYPNNPSSGRSE